MRRTCTWSFIFNCHNSLSLSLSPFHTFYISFSFTECVHCSHHRDICWDQSAISADVGVKEQYHLYCYNTGTAITLTDTQADKVVPHGQLYVATKSDLILNISWTPAFFKAASSHLGTECKKSVCSSKLSSLKLHEFRRIKGMNTNTFWQEWLS